MSSSTPQLQRMLMISGQQQNIGKTTLACNIIASFGHNTPIYALKVSPHLHENVGSATLAGSGKNWQLLMETSTSSGNKDTSRMLMAGAEQAFLLQGGHNSLQEGFDLFMKLIPSDAMIVCESAGLRDYIQPGVFLAIRQLFCKICTIDDEKIFRQADRIVTFTVNGFDFSVSSLEIENGSWKLINN
jgi:hypothetical protein